MNENIVEFLNELIEFELGIISAYEEAIEGAKSTQLREKLTEFLNDHHGHLERLRSLVRAYGGTPDDDRDLGGWLMEALTAIVAFGDTTALLAMRRIEEISLRTYRAALRPPLPRNVRAVLADNYADEQRHLAWIVAALRGRLRAAEESA
jgi:uncharacterized protein (TIGR02284 family)